MKYITKQEVTLVGNETRYNPPYVAYDRWGGRMYERFYIVEGGYIPKYLGVAYDDWAYCATVYYPIPLNYIVRIVRPLFWKIMRMFYWVGIIDTSIGEAFSWDDFYRIKTH